MSNIFDWSGNQRRQTKMVKLVCGKVTEGNTVPSLQATPTIDVDLRNCLIKAGYEESKKWNFEVRIKGAIHFLFCGTYQLPIFNHKLLSKRGTYAGNRE